MCQWSLKLADLGLQQTSFADQSMSAITLFSLQPGMWPSNITVLPLLSKYLFLVEVEAFFGYLAFKCLVSNSDNYIDFLDCIFIYINAHTFMYMQF